MASITPTENTTNSHDHHLYTRIRAPKKSDIPSIHKLLHKMAEFHNATGCQVTESSLNSTLFTNPQPTPVNVFILEVSSSPFPLHPSIIEKTFDLLRPVNDSEVLIFQSEIGTTIAGFVLFYPTYCSFFGKPGFRIQDLFVRESYRSLGFGELLMKAVANEAVNLGYVKVEWSVVDWNVGATKFYERIGACVLEDWKTFELTNDALFTCGKIH